MLTEEQQAKIWRWCGLKDEPIFINYQLSQTENLVSFPDGTKAVMRKGKWPILSLDGLFVGAIRKLYHCCSVYSITFTQNGCEIETHHEDVYRGGQYHPDWTAEEYAESFAVALLKLIENEEQQKIAKVA